MPSPDPNAIDTWSRGLARLEGEPEPAASATSDAIGAEDVPAWFAALAAVPTTKAPPTPAPAATTALPPPAPKPAAIDEAEPIGAWVWRRWAERRGRGG